MSNQSPILGPGVAQLGDVENMLDKKQSSQQNNQNRGKDLTREEIAAIRKAKKEKAKADKLAKQKKAAENKEKRAAAARIPKKVKQPHVPRTAHVPRTQGNPNAGASKAGGDSKRQNQQKQKQGQNKSKNNNNNNKSIITRISAQKQVALFSHLPQWEKAASSPSLKVGFSGQELHPSLVRVGLQMASGTIIGSNARAVALLTALKEYLASYVPPKTNKQTIKQLITPPSHLHSTPTIYNNKSIYIYIYIMTGIPLHPAKC